VRTFKLTLTYDGSSFVGWQRQAEGDSIQGVLEEVLARFDGKAVTVHGAGRTDAGVHALGQVASVVLETSIDGETLARALNAQLPAAIRVLRADVMPDGFHARFSATSKTYRYLIATGPVASPFTRAFTWHLAEPLDVLAMRRAARALLGRHDFSAFRSVGGGSPDSVRIVSRAEVLVLPAASGPLSWTDTGDLIAVEMAADGFLRHMVRAVVGTLVEVGRGWRRPESVGTLVSGVERSAAGATAPPQGLFLVRVDYDQGPCPS
jgi:tRNA pseudouridine38-40 synthase